MADLHHSEAAPLAGAFRTAVTLAELLQRVEASTTTIGPDQYRALVLHLGQLLGRLPPGDGLQRPAEVYENLHYSHAGLCRAPLAQSLNSELAARQLIERVQATRA